MLNKKSIVLNGVENRSQRAVLTLECDGEMTSGRVRLYNFGVEPRGIISLGINDGTKIIKAGLTHTSGMLFTFMSDIRKLPENFSCAIVNFVNGEPKPLLYGSSEGYVEKDEIFDQVINNIKKAKNIDEVEKELDKYGVDYQDDEKELIEKEIDKAINSEDISTCSHNCDECKYKKFYMSRVQNEQNNEKEELVVDERDLRNTNSFYNEMKEQIDNLFANNPNEDYLQELIPNSKWVKVNIDEEGDYYVLGLLYEDEELKYICYGVPGVFQRHPPKELSGYPIWFPLDTTKPEGFGYWLSYQDSNSGESVKAVVV